jgi:hypothetical protein
VVSAVGLAVVLGGVSAVGLAVGLAVVSGVGLAVGTRHNFHTVLHYKNV